MKIKFLENIKQKLAYQAQNINNALWSRYAKWILPIVIVLITIINWTIFHFVSKETETQIQGNTRELIELQKQHIEKVYESHMHTIHLLFDGFTMDRLDEYMKKADRFVNMAPENYDKYVRLTFRDGKSYTSNRGLDSINFAKFDIPRMIFHENVPFVMTSPYLSVDNVRVKHYGIHFPLIQNDSIIAVITTTIPREVIDGPVSKLNVNGSGIPGIIHNKEMIVIFEDGKYGRTLRKEEFDKLGLIGLDKVLENSEKSKRKEEFRHDSYTAIIDGKPQEVTVYSSFIKNTDWGITMSIINSDMNRNVHILMIIIILLSLATIAILYFALKYITDKVVIDPIGKANQFAKDFSEGKLHSNEIDNMDDHNEFGQMKMKMTDMRSRLTEVVNNIRNHADEINNGSETLVNLAKEIDEGAQAQAASTEEIFASIESITESVKQINDNASDAAMLSNQMSEDISRISQFSRTTLETIENVIGKIAIINDITQRTDMLAINASVEAARAGQFGAGFAQVAGEIRKLAEVCQTASSEINASSAQSLKIIQYAVSLIASIEPKVKQNADMVTEISQSCTNQISLANSMTLPIQQLVEITSSNSTNAEELSHYVEKLKDTCQKLINSVEFFKTTDDSETQQQLIDEIDDCTREIDRLRVMLNTYETENQ